jgi:F0F1-type ATP synthase assembly protein I
MSDQSHPDTNDQPAHKPAPQPADNRGEGMVWSAIGTLIAGPVVWGGFGWALDRWLETPRVFTAAGVVVGFITSLYIVYIKFGRD